MQYLRFRIYDPAQLGGRHFKDYTQECVVCENDESDIVLSGKAENEDEALASCACLCQWHKEPF